MLVIEKDAREKLREAFKHARTIGDIPASRGRDIPAIDQFKDQLRYLDTYAEHEDRGRTLCRLWSDLAPHSFYFAMKVRDEDAESGYRLWFNGGLIFHGAHDNGGDGEDPTFSVSLTPASGWRVHT